MRPSLLELVAAHDDLWKRSAESVSSSTPTETSSLLSFFLRLFLGKELEQPPEEWIPQLNLPRLREVAAEAISLTLTVTSTLRAVWRDGRAQIDWQPRVTNLVGAIEWSMWHDLAGRRPLVVCKNCQNVFHPDYA